jgi:hypothetical protein
MKIRSTSTLAAIFLVGVGGFMAGRVYSPGTLGDAKNGPERTYASRVSSRDLAADDATARKISRTSKKEASEKSTPKARLAKLESIVRSENPLERNRALMAFLDSLGPGEFEEAVAHFRALGITESRTGEYALLLTAWAQADPVAALTYAEKNTNSGFAQDTILTSWASTDLEAAIRWAKSNHTGDDPNPYLPGIIRGISQSDPARATELLAGMPRSVERGKGLDFVMPHLLEQGADATHQWISAITDDSLRNGAIMRAAGKLAESDPAGTASWLLANPGEAAQRQMDNVYSTWADRDRQAALASLGKLPAGDLRSNALRGIVSTVAGSDPKAALSMMDRYPNDVNDRMIQNFVWHSSGSDPATAASQIARIGDEQQRDQMYRRMLGNWMNNDAPSAQAWMASHAIPDAVRDRINRR